MFTLSKALLLSLAIALPLPAMAGEITVFAAASLKDALDKAAADWSSATGNTVTVSYGGTPQLARQIEQGAPADLFLSASSTWMDTLTGEKLIDRATRVDLWGNSIVLVSGDPKAQAVTIDGALDLPGLLGGGKLSMALVDSVPAGQYGKEALVSLGLWDRIAPSVAQSENVRVALALVARAEAPLGIVYATDAVAEPAVKVIGTFPQNSHKPITYPGAVTANAADPGDAVAFLSWLGKEGQADFAAQGFTILTK